MRAPVCTAVRRGQPSPAGPGRPESAPGEIERGTVFEFWRDTARKQAGSRRRTDRCGPLPEWTPRGPCCSIRSRAGWGAPPRSPHVHCIWHPRVTGSSCSTRVSIRPESAPCWAVLTVQPLPGAWWTICLNDPSSRPRVSISMTITTVSPPRSSPEGEKSSSSRREPPEADMWISSHASITVFPKVGRNIPSLHFKLSTTCRATMCGRRPRASGPGLRECGPG